MNNSTERTIVTLVTGQKVIYVYATKNSNAVAVPRLSLAAQRKCVYVWKTIDFGHRGHGGWNMGCLKCGALCR